MRQCGGCTLCCKLLPVRELDKPADTRCRHQKTGKGCRVYNSPAMPFSCHVWHCRWLMGAVPDELSRPDRAAYVIDLLQDFVVARDEVSGKETKIGVIQVWVDPARPEQWRDDDAFFRYVTKIAETERLATIVRYGSGRAIVLAAPCLSDDNQWHIVESGMVAKEHTAKEIADAGFGLNIEVRYE